MSPSRVHLALAVAFLVQIVLPRSVHADPAPTIQTFEAQKQRGEIREARRNPKAFWMRQIVEEIERHRPVLAKPLKDPLTVTVDFVVSRDGHVRSRSIEKSSGVVTADKLALDMVDRAAPFPPMPATLGEDQLTFVLPIRFH